MIKKGAPVTNASHPTRERDHQQVVVIPPKGASFMQKRDLCSSSVSLPIALALFVAGGVGFPRCGLAQNAPPEVPQQVAPVVAPVNAVTGPAPIGGAAQHTRLPQRFSVAQLSAIDTPPKKNNARKKRPTYHPCPANVIMRNGRHACLG
jgi:hypothetical protein